jgi:DNA-binding SARP family transcriptional activator/TolB-like protein/Flp pilus assembly protein TadD
MIRLRTLGALELQHHDGTEVRSVLAQTKRFALLAYLAVASPRSFHRRDTLLGIFWPELDDERARSALSQALYYLRQSLGSDVVVSRGKDEVGLDPDGFWCDVVELDEALDSGRPERIRDAVELYRGDLLPGFFLSDAPEFERWLEAERARLRDRIAKSTWDLVGRAETAGRIGEAVSWGRRALALAGSDEGQLRRLIEMMDRAGDRAGAVRLYEEVADRLAREYEIAPAPETQQLIAEIRARSEPVSKPLAPDGPDQAPERGEEVVASPAAPSPVPPANPGGANEPAPSRVASRRRRLLAGIAAGGIIVVVGGILLWPGATRSTDSGAPGNDPNHVAVLPLDNLSPDATDAYIADGLTAELISRLSRLRDVRVAPMSSVLAYRGVERSPRQVGQELGVGLIVEGNSRPMGDSVRLTIFLVEPGTEELVWSKSYDADLGGLLGIQQRIADEIALELKVTNRDATERRRTDSRAADEYLRGRALLAQLDGSVVMTLRRREDLLLQARDHFTAAVDHDSTFADAWSGLASINVGLARSGLVTGAAIWEQARDAAERALSHDDQLPEAHTALATVYSFGDGDGPKAVRHLERAMELDPSYAAAYDEYGMHLRGMGRLEEALAMVRRARELAPRAEGYTVGEGQLLYMLGRYDEAIDLMDRFLADPPPTAADGPLDSPGTSSDVRPFWAHFTLALAQTAKGDYEAALETLQTGDPTGSRADTYALLGYLYAKTGRAAEAHALLERMDDLEAMDDPPVEGPISDFHRAVIHVGLGEYDRALDLLESARGERTRLLRLLKVEPMLEPIRDHPRFQALLRRLGMADTATSAAARPDPD